MARHEKGNENAFSQSYSFSLAIGFFLHLHDTFDRLSQRSMEGFYNTSYDKQESKSIASKPAFPQPKWFFVCERLATFAPCELGAAACRQHKLRTDELARRLSLPIGLNSYLADFYHSG